MKTRIPVPPRSKCIEIVKVLDTFTELEAELEAELEVEVGGASAAMTSTTDALLAFAIRDVRGPRWPRSASSFGAPITKADYVEDGVACIHYGEISHSLRHVSECRDFPSSTRDETDLRFANRAMWWSPTWEKPSGCRQSGGMDGADDVAIHDHYAFRHSMNLEVCSYCSRPDHSSQRRQSAGQSHQGEHA